MGGEEERQTLLKLISPPPHHQTNQISKPYCLSFPKNRYVKQQVKAHKGLFKCPAFLKYYNGVDCGHFMKEL